MELATTQRDNLVLTRQLFEFFGEHDMDAFMSVLDDDVEAHPSVGGGAALRGREAVSAWWESFASLDGEIEVRPLEYELRGDCVIVRGYLRQRSGRTLAESQMFWLYEIKDGKVVRMESLPSRGAALARIGSD